MCFIHGCKRLFSTTTDSSMAANEADSVSLSLSISMAQIWEVLHPWLHPTLQIHDSSLFLYKWALEIAERGKSCMSFFILGATTGKQRDFGGVEKGDDQATRLDPRKKNISSDFSR
ncbi:uncharacterized protein LOC130996242 isoform X2 [Salvia miltiorrhiza]|uniref:uncharacterized protein LOC130996242 isoform X2 n=1 Tax=Salvia miltiorrhiza TaxID=226208 RepID=UPI0025AC8145|nr:uncharacterized protein LOC130996242 isoform X2 [Salvia miltiorrhiza]